MGVLAQQIVAAHGVIMRRPAKRVRLWSAAEVLGQRAMSWEWQADAGQQRVIGRIITAIEKVRVDKEPKLLDRRDRVDEIGVAQDC